MTVRGQARDEAGENSSDFRLHRLEVSNWGPFDGGATILELDAATGLVTGDPGAGQSALAAAIVELLAPAERAITRTAEDRSVVLGVFRTSCGTKTVSLAQVFQRTSPQVEPARLYVCAEQELSVASHFDVAAAGSGALVESLRRLGAQVEPGPRKYVAWFRRRFGIRDAYALRSLRAMASMRAAGDVDDAVRRHVLDPFDPSPRLGELLAAFGELERANHALQDLRQAEAMLSSILTKCEAHDSQSRAVADLHACREGLPAHFARHRLALLDKRLACMRSIREQLSAQIARLEGRLEERRGQADALRTAVATNGGERLERLSAEIRRLVGSRDARRAKAERYDDLLRRIGEAAPADEAAFHVQRNRLKLMRDEARDRDAYLERALPGYGARLADVQRELDLLPAEIESLKARQGDVAGEQREDPSHRQLAGVPDPAVDPGGTGDRAAKIAALEVRLHQLEVRVTAIANLIAREQGQRKALAERLETLARLEELADFAELDWAATAAEIADRIEERQLLESSSDVLKQLSQRLQQVEHEIVRTEGEADTAKDRRSRIEQRMHDAETLRSQTETLLVPPQPAPGSHSPSGLAERLESLRAQALGGQELSLETLDEVEGDVRARLARMLHAEEVALVRLEETIAQAMQCFQAEFAGLGDELHASPGSAAAYRDLLDRLRREDLPRLESDFQGLVHVAMSDEFASLDATLARAREAIEARIARLNRSLVAIEHAPGCHIALQMTPRRETDIDAFRAELRFCAERTPSGSRDMQCAKAKLDRMRRLIEPIRGRADSAAAHREWRTKVFDVRNWFAFTAMKCSRSDGRASADCVSAGMQDEGVAFTVLATNLVDRLALEQASRRSLRFAVLGAAFSRGPDDALRHALALFRQRDVQVLVFAPLAKVPVVEPFVARVGFVHNARGGASTLRNVSIEAGGAKYSQ